MRSPSDLGYGACKSAVLDEVHHVVHLSGCAMGRNQPADLIAFTLLVAGCYCIALARQKGYR